MQIGISKAERSALVTITAGRGRAKWFIQKSGISYQSMAKLRRGGMADETVVEKVRTALKSSEVKRLMKVSECAA